jgi:hypothetical protein
MLKTFLAALVIVALIGLLVLMLVSWRRRTRRQAHIPAPDPRPTDLGSPLGRFAGLYLATTPAGQPLERIAVHGLGFRSRTTLEVFEAGVVLLDDLFIPAASITGSGTASWTIDRGVEPDGLNVIAWDLGPAHLESYFRFDDATGFADAMSKTVNRAAQTGLN